MIYIYNEKDDDPDKRGPGVSFLGTYHSLNSLQLSCSKARVLLNQLSDLLVFNIFLFEYLSR